MTQRNEEPDVLRFAACDIGSNASRLVIVRVLGGSEPFVQREASYRVPLRLGDDVFTDGSVSEKKITGLGQILGAFERLVRFFEPMQLRACATSALRDAKNGRAVVERLREEIGIELEIISGAEEAQLLHSSLPEAARDSSVDHLYVDVGGGSTELTLIANGRPLCSESFRIGGVRLLRATVEPSEWERMRSFTERLPRSERPLRAVGTGGNIEQIAERIAGDSTAPVNREAIAAFLRKLEPMSIEERIRSLGLKPDRADVIVPAGGVYVQVMQWARVESMVVPKVGLADGMLRQMFETYTGRRSSAAELGQPSASRMPGKRDLGSEMRVGMPPETSKS